MLNSIRARVLYLAVVLEFFHVHVSSVASLGVIIALLAAGTIASLHKNRQAASSGVKVLLKDSQDAAPLKSVNAV